MGEAAAKRDLRSEWCNSPELRRAVQDELSNWGVWSHAGKPNLGYPRENHCVEANSKCPPACDVDQAQRTEDNLVMWKLVCKHGGDEMQNQWLTKLLFILRVHYTTSKAAHVKAEITGVSRRQFYRLLEDAEYRYWVISWA